MTDITSPAPPPRPALAAGTPAETGGPDGEAAPPELVAFAELLYFAYRSFTADPDAVLARYGFGRAHHRVLHFVHRNPGLKVAQLLDILKITKQSLARVLKELREKGCIAQRPGPDDLRERRLYATAKGARLAHKLSELQAVRLSEALKSAGPSAGDTAMTFLFAMIEPHERDHVAALVRWTPPQPQTSEQRGPP